MTKLFGLPVDTVLVVLAILLGVTLGGLALLALRNRCSSASACATRAAGPLARR